MANKIANIPVLDQVIDQGYIERDGTKIPEGNLWGLLVIYRTMMTLQVSISTLCKVASRMENRLDAKMNPTTKPINSRMFIKYLKLESIPTHASHVIVTKTVARGVDPAISDEIKNVLLDHNSYGLDLHNALLGAMDKKKNKLLNSRYSLLGGSDYNAVLLLCLVLTELAKAGIIGDMSEIKSSDHPDLIIKIITENPEHASKISGTLGYWS